MTTIGEVAGILRGYRFTYTSEMQLHDGLALALEEHGLSVQREVALGEGLGRLDLLVDRVAVEVKISGGPTEVARQVSRYLSCDALDGVVLVTSRVAHLAISHPRLEVVTLAGGGL